MFRFSQKRYGEHKGYAIESERLVSGIYVIIVSRLNPDNSLRDLQVFEHYEKAILYIDNKVKEVV